MAQNASARSLSISLRKPGMRRKAQIFVMTALMITGFLILLFSGAITPPLDQGIGATKARVSALGRFMDKFPAQATTALTSQSQQAFEQLSQTMLVAHRYVPDAQSAFLSCMMNGTVTLVGVGSPQACGTIQNSTLPRVLDAITQLSGQSLQATVNYSIGNVAMRQESPFQVIVSVNITYYVIDPVASWNRTIALQVPVDIQGVTDPYYAVEAGSGAYAIKKTEIQSWNISAFSSFVAAHEYRYNQNGTSFLGRYTHTISASSCCGIESVVDPSAIVPQSNSSYVDRLFLEHVQYHCLTPDDQLRNFTGIDPRLALDIGSALSFNVFNSSTSACSP